MHGWEDALRERPGYQRREEQPAQVDLHLETQQLEDGDLLSKHLLSSHLVGADGVPPLVTRVRGDVDKRRQRAGAAAIGPFHTGTTPRPDGAAR